MSLDQEHNTMNCSRPQCELPNPESNVLTIKSPQWQALHNQLLTCLVSTCSGDTACVSVTCVSALPALGCSVRPALHSSTKENFNVTSALRMGSKLEALLHERAVCTTFRIYSH